MSADLSIPPLRNLPPGRLDALADQLLSEIMSEPARRPRRAASSGWSPRRVAIVVGAAAAVAAASAVALWPTSGARSHVNPRSAAPPIAPLYSLHASVTSTSRSDRYLTPSGLKPDLDTRVAPFVSDVALAAAYGKDVPRAVLLLAAAEAHAYGNGDRTLVQWVKTTRQKAVSAENAGRVDGGRLPVYFVILHGHFVDYATPRPPGAKSPRGRILTDTIEVKTGRALDFGITNSEPSFAKTGRPHHFVIYGHRRSR